MILRRTLACILALPCFVIYIFFYILTLASTGLSMVLSLISGCLTFIYGIAFLVVGGMIVFDSDLSIFEKFQFLGFIIGICALLALVFLFSGKLTSILASIGLFFLSVPKFLWGTEE